MFLGPARVTAFSSSPLQLVVSFTSVEKWFHFRLEVFFSFLTFFAVSLKIESTQPSEEAQVQTVLQQKARPLNHPRLRGQPGFK